MAIDVTREHYLGFRAIVDPWVRYRLEDGTNLRLRVLISKIRGRRDPVSGETAVEVLQSAVVATEAPDELRGERGRAQYSPEEIEANLQQRDVPFTPLSSEPSFYELEDGNIVRLEPGLERVDRTSLHTADGDPVYRIVWRASVAVYRPALARVPDARGEPPAEP